MPASPAQIAANRQNAQLSKGPTSPEGKRRSARNSFKHGLTGQGIVLPVEDAAEVQERFETLQLEMAPKGLLAQQLVRRVAFLTVRIERCEGHEAKYLAHKARHAAEAFDDARMAEVEKAYSWIAAEPATHARRLRSSPEGCDRLLQALRGLQADLANPDGVIWDYRHCDHLHHLLGLRMEDVPYSRAKALSDAAMGHFKLLRSADRPDLVGVERQAWASGELFDLVTAEVAALEAHRATLDLAAIELDRAEAGTRALFDASKEAVLARKYEAATERGLFRTLKEFRQVQAESPPPRPGPDEPEPVEELGSFFPTPEGEPDAEEEMDAADDSGPSGVVEGSEIAPEGPSEAAPGGESIDDR